MRLPELVGVLRPATPPADFDLYQAVTSLRKFRGPDVPREVALAHYGLLPDPLDMLEEAEGNPAPLGHEVAERAWRAGLGYRRGADRRRFSSEMDQAPAEQPEPSSRPSTAFTAAPPASGSGSRRPKEQRPMHPHPH